MNEKQRTKKKNKNKKKKAKRAKTSKLNAISHGTALKQTTFWRTNPGH